MRMLKLALLLVGVAFGANSFADDESVIMMFNEGDQQSEMEMDNPDSARTWINCTSHNFRMNRCHVNGRILSVRLIRRLSYAPCIAGRTFGATPRFVWVTRGCSGQFLVQYRRWGGGGGWGDDQH